MPAPAIDLHFHPFQLGSDLEIPRKVGELGLLPEFPEASHCRNHTSAGGAPLAGYSWHPLVPRVPCAAQLRNTISANSATPARTNMPPTTCMGVIRALDSDCGVRN